MKVKYKVNIEHTSENTDPIVLNIGDKVKLGEKSDDNGPWPNWIYCTSKETSKAGWTPIQVLDIQGDSAIVIEYYNAKEMTVLKGEILAGSTVLNGWTCCTRESDGEQGWVPSQNIEKCREVLGDKLMISKEYMMKSVYNQLSIDYNCYPEDFLKEGLIFTEAKQNDGRRPMPWVTPRLTKEQ